MQTFLGTFPGTPTEPDPPLRIRDVIAETGLKKSAIYEKMKKGEFPLATKMSERVTIWYPSQIRDWKASRPTIYATPEVIDAAEKARRCILATRQNDRAAT